MFEDYKKAILDFYRIKKENHRLSLNLEAPRRDRLRAECAKVFLRKNSKVDRDFIRSVFDPTNEYEDQMRSIERFDLDRFRALVSFLTIEGRDIRDDRLVKLLAWLIDFPPYNEWRELSEEKLKLIFEEAAKTHIEESLEEEDKNDDTIDGGEFKCDEKEIQLEDSNEDEPKNEEDQSSDELEEYLEEDHLGPLYIPRFSIRHIAIVSIILLFIGTTSFVAWERRAITVRKAHSDEKFMYWDEDHYEPVKDEKQNVGAPIIPLNENTLRQQQKITLPDTLTSYSIGKVWYKGHGKDHEFFTSSGAYPQDLQRVLKPLTSTILTRYTSNYRYILTRLVWFICAAFFIGLCGYGASKLEKKVKPAVKESDTEEEETTALLGNELQATGA